MLEYDFLSELTNYYPSSLPLNPNANSVKVLTEKENLLADTAKENEIYKKALGITLRES